MGVAPATLRGTQRYYVEEGTLAWGAIRKCKADCPKPSWTGLGDAHFVPVGVDLRWKEIREREANEASQVRKRRIGVRVSERSR